MSYYNNEYHLPDDLICLAAKDAVRRQRQERHWDQLPDLADELRSLLNEAVSPIVNEFYCIDPEATDVVRDAFTMLKDDFADTPGPTPDEDAAAR